MFPYDFDADEIVRRLDSFGLELVLFNLPAGDWAAGERGIAGHPGREAEFRAGVEQALQLAKKFGTRRLNALAGLWPVGGDNAVVARTLVDNLRFAAALLEPEGIRLLIEPINSRVDMPGFWLDTPEKACEIIRQVAHPNLGLQFDVYHAHVMGGDVLAQIETLLPITGHIQIADAPGRHQPGSGQINFPSLFQRLEAHAYSGWVGCEFRPHCNMAQALEWAAPWLAPSPPSAGLA